MKKNIGSADITARVAIAVVIALLYSANFFNGVAGTLLLVVAALLLITGVINFCPLYSIFGINTCKRNS